MDNTVIIAGGTAPILSRLPAPPAGDRWVGPLPPVIQTHPERPEEERGGWASTPQGGEYTRCYTPTRNPSDPSYTVTTDTSGRACVRTDEGWWVAVPADRPSWLAAQVACTSDTREVGPDYQGPIREGHPLAWRDLPPGTFEFELGWTRHGVGAGGRWTRSRVLAADGCSRTALGPWHFEGGIGDRLPPAAVELALSWGIDPRTVVVKPMPDPEVRPDSRV